MITAEDMEGVEKRLKIRGDIGGMVAVHATADVDSDALARLCQHHGKTVHQRVPELDPRSDPFVHTMLAHFFIVGAACAREDEKRRKSQ